VLEEFANDYIWAEGAPDNDDTQFWTQLSTQLVQIEQQIFDASVQYTSMYGWNNTDPHEPHVFFRTFPTDANWQGKFVPGVGDIAGAGDQAAYIRWLGSKKSKAGKPTYFRKYPHRPWTSSTDRDKLSPDYLAALTAYASSSIWTLKGTFINQFDQNKYNAGDNYATGPGTVSPWVTTRSLKRRGKRPVPKASPTLA